MYILGINAYHPDSAACLIKDGQLIAAAEEERFKRIKHWSGLPREAIKFCLEQTQIEFGNIDYIGISRNPYIHLMRKIWFILNRRPKLSFIKSRIDNLIKIKDIKSELSDTFSLQQNLIKAKVYNIEHHQAHMASSFFVSGFDGAAILSIDALGDFVSTMFGVGRKNNLKVIERIFFPHSLGFLYTAGTQFLGFMKFGDEYKVMGLAAYGRPIYVDKFKEILKFKKGGKFVLNLSYFRYYSQGIEMTWHNQEPVSGILYSDKWQQLLGPPRNPQDEITQHHKDIARSLQALLEEGCFHILNYLYSKTRLDKLCLAGGVALNCVANGKIYAHTPFKQIYIQPAAGDAGTAIGTAYYIYHQILNRSRCFVMEHAYWGPQFDESEINKQLEFKKKELKDINCRIEKLNNSQIIKKTAELIAGGKIVGWFQGRMEWGPRALGNRSILVDPRRKEMRDILNDRIKRREWFRPFATSISSENVVEYLERNRPDQFMLKAYLVKQDKREFIPAVTHIDGTSRVQTVDKEQNYLFWQIIKEFQKITGIPALLNTSFNENEPIVCKPHEALDCFLRTKMDALILGNYLVQKQNTI